MPKRKRLKWERNRALPHVYQPCMRSLVDGALFRRGTWHDETFGNRNPITLELGCGEGTYTVELARRYPERNFIGVDIKGHRFWKGAQRAHDEGLTNAAFLRAKVEFLDRCFAADEVDELWLTFSDPQPKDERGTKRITSSLYLGLYQTFVRPGGLVHVKSDSPFLFETTRDGARAEGYELRVESDDVHGALIPSAPPELASLLSLVTKYEQRWIREGRKIHYLQVRLPDERRSAQVEAALEALQGSRRLSVLHADRVAVGGDEETPARA